MASSRPQAAFSQSDIAVITGLGKRKAELAQQRSEISNQIDAIQEEETNSRLNVSGSKASIRSLNILSLPIK